MTPSNFDIIRQRIDVEVQIKIFLSKNVPFSNSISNWYNSRKQKLKTELLRKKIKWHQKHKNWSRMVLCDATIKA